MGGLQRDRDLGEHRVDRPTAGLEAATRSDAERIARRYGIGVDQLTELLQKRGVFKA